MPPRNVSDLYRLELYIGAAHRYVLEFLSMFRHSLFLYKNRPVYVKCRVIRVSVLEVISRMPKRVVESIRFYPYQNF